MIYISSGGDRKKTGYEFAVEAGNYGITNIELSGGRYDEHQLEKLKKIRNNYEFQVHNYFPPPEQPFVLNLASSNAEIVSKSIDHINKAMEWSVELGQPRYSFHAGFLIDPQIKELGGNLKQYKLENRNTALERFIDKVNMLAERADLLGVQLLIENNVLSSRTWTRYNENPLLMATDEECSYVMKNTLKNVKLLLDVAHLKVTAKTLEFDPAKFIAECNEWIDGYHLSDNDGLEDRNDPINHASWFWKILNKDKTYYSLEVYGKTFEELHDQKLIVDSKLKEYHE